MTTVNEAKLERLLGRVVGDIGAVTTAPLVVIGEELGLYRAMADGRPVSAAALAERTGIDSIQDNLNPLGRAFYGASTLICTPASLAQDVGRGLGAQAGEEALRQVAAEAGLGRFRRAAQTPFNLVLQARR